jgi:hypothetical protein
MTDMNMDYNDAYGAHIGELSSETFTYRGVCGYLVDDGFGDPIVIGGVKIRTAMM